MANTPPNRSDATIPTATPVNARRRPRPATRPTSPSGVAPRAIRTPIFSDPIVDVAAQNPVEPDRDEHQRHHRKGRQEPRQHLRGSGDHAQLIVHRLDLIDKLFRVDFENPSPNRRGDARQGGIGLEHEREQRPVGLLGSDKDLGHDLFVRRPLPNPRNHADDFDLLIARNSHSLSDGSITEEGPCEFLIHDRRAPIAERPAADERNPHHGEVSGADGSD